MKEYPDKKEVAHVSSTANLEWVQIAVFDSGLVVLPRILICLRNKFLKTSASSSIGAMPGLFIGASTRR